MKIKLLNDKSAQKEISTYLMRQKERGVSRVSAMEISDSVKLPPAQVGRVMEKFEKDGRVKAI